jgi:hypothetical protein
MRRRFSLAVAATTFAWIGLASGFANGPKFFRDDPLTRDPETQDASGVREAVLSQLYDFTENSFLGAGERADKAAENVNTIDQVPDSSWFTNRIGRETWTVEQIVKGPDTGAGPVGKWTIVSGKMEGRAAGFTIRDSTNQLYFIKFDPPTNPEMATAAEVISTKFFHAFGYHVPENYLAWVGRDNLEIGENARFDDKFGQRRTMDQRDLDALLEQAPKDASGRYRAVASKALEGKPVGPFRYYGTRADDPNDIFPHEHRRELRGLRAFCAWLNHDDSRSVNTFDALVQSGGRTIVRHNLLDFGSTLGSGTVQAQSPRAGNEFLWESRPTFITMLTLGFYVRPWIKVPYPDIPSLGRIESDYFSPEEWKPEYPNAAFANARPEDLFWAARILARLPDDAVRAVVKAAQYSDEKASAYLIDTLLERKAKVLRTWLNATNPLVDFALSPGGELTFGNAAEKAAIATAAQSYTVEWSAFDNASDTHKSIGTAQTLPSATAQAPESLVAARPEYVAAIVRAHSKEHPQWAQPVKVYFRRTGDNWSLVGLERY